MGERQSRVQQRVQAVGTAVSKAYARNSEEARCQEQTRPGTGASRVGRGRARKAPCLLKVNIPGLGPARLL